MLVVPELETVFILVPRTGTSSLISEIGRVYPRSKVLYRHMQADGAPLEYASWRKIGFVRHPLSRFWSLYRYLFPENGPGFEAWLFENDEPLLWGHTEPFCRRLRWVPENKTSQYDWLRPDIGTEVRPFSALRNSFIEWGLDPGFRAGQTFGEFPEPNLEITKHLEHYCAWDLQQNCDLV